MALITTLVGTSLQASAATTYPDALNAESPVTGEVTLPTTPPGIPPIDPESPEPPIDPEEGNPELGDGLSILYVSPLDFGQTEFSTEAQTLLAEKLVDEDENEFENRVTVTDLRADRDGWELTVAQSSELMDGATLTMYPNAHAGTAAALGVTTASGQLLLSTDAATFATADNETADAGIISMGMGEVELNLPASAGAGEYSTTLNWTLTNGPVAPDLD
ncbi:WxL domain-containing protein [Enterococcus sp. 4E1_DIV0656]|uniref:WxL domain-containing protein n=1 Tax=Enterococcus sp. 4E1_DIV0656 TaxID=1834180 RepID=UPI0015950228|nr:WxL domain-containing protein [Enterococcus sp. 4E1_DIV0656]